MAHSDIPSATDATELDSLVTTGTSSESLAPGTRLGVYRIRRALGEGGMGQVYLAEQTAPVHRDVALKLIRQQIASPLALALFEVERQALAQMQHPAIAQIFDAGTTAEGHAYIAMEHVEGTPLAEYCREHRLSRDQRLALFIRICQGVQHAHQKGVIHRDLKPSNVLVRDIDAMPMPKIIDFGIAIGAAHSESGVVVSGAHSDNAGTALYMSPEQAAGEGRDIDTRSDVYALGVMLLEILTDTDAATLHSTAGASRVLLTPGAAEHASRTARDSNRNTAQLVDASTDLPVELRAALRKALARDRNDRYASATALAEDLERYRRHRPLHAMPASRTYSARKFIARHRLGILAATVAAVALIAGIVLAVQGQHRAEVSATQARIEANKAEQVANFVQQMIAGIDPDRAKGLDRSLMRLMLDAAATRADEQLANQPQVRTAIERTIAQSYSSIGEFALGAEHFGAAREAAEAAAAPLAERARLLVARAESIGNLGRFDEALEIGKRAFDEVASLPADSRDRLFIESKLAWLELGVGQFEASIERYQRVLAMQEKTLGAEDNDTLETQRGLAANYSRVDRWAEAEPLLRHVLDVYRKRFGAESTRALSLTTGLGVNYLEQARYAEAREVLRPALAATEKLLGREHPNTMILVSNLGSAIRNGGDLEEARPYYERVLATSLKQNGPDFYLSVSAESNLALLLLDAGDIDEAEKHARLSIAHLEKAFPPGHPARAIFLTASGKVLTAAGKYAEAEQQLDQAYALFLASPGFGPTHSRTRDAVENFVTLYASWGKPQLEARWRKVLEDSATVAEAPVTG